MLVFARAFNLLVFLLACIGVMVVFMGGAGYLPVLLVLLALSLPVSLAMTAVGVAWFARRHGLGAAISAIWHAMPQWLAVTFWLGAALMLCGELALLMAMQLENEPLRLWQHLPLLAGLNAAMAYCVVDAVRRTR